MLQADLVGHCPRDCGQRLESLPWCQNYGRYLLWFPRYHHHDLHVRDRYAPDAWLTSVHLLYGFRLGPIVLCNRSSSPCGNDAPCFPEHILFRVCHSWCLGCAPGTTSRTSWYVFSLVSTCYECSLYLVWLAAQGRHEQGKKALKFLIGNVEGYDLTSEYQVMVAEVETSKAASSAKSRSEWLVLFKQPNLKRAIISTLPFTFTVSTRLGSDNTETSELRRRAVHLRPDHLLFPNCWS